MIILHELKSFLLNEGFKQSLEKKNNINFTKGSIKICTSFLNKIMTYCEIRHLNKNKSPKDIYILSTNVWLYEFKKDLKKNLKYIYLGNFESFYDTEIKRITRYSSVVE
ncbi:MAG: hypothetical protein ABIP51_15110 [Bacteroidia bacterium]